MTRKYHAPVDTNTSITNGMKFDTEGEYLERMWEDLQQHDAGKSVGASQDNGTIDGSLKYTKALEPSS